MEPGVELVPQGGTTVSHVWLPIKKKNDVKVDSSRGNNTTVQCTSSHVQFWVKDDRSSTH